MEKRKKEAKKERMKGEWERQQGIRTKWRDKEKGTEKKGRKI